jgi:heme/copper-type cytochrome/quinol oxidase subunit 2
LDTVEDGEIWTMQTHPWAPKKKDHTRHQEPIVLDSMIFLVVVVVVVMVVMVVGGARAMGNE